MNAFAHPKRIRLVSCVFIILTQLFFGIDQICLAGPGVQADLDARLKELEFHISQSDPDKAKRVAKAIEKLAMGSSDQFKKAIYFYRLGQIAEQKGRTAEANAKYAESLKVCPSWGITIAAEEATRYEINNRGGKLPPKSVGIKDNRLYNKVVAEHLTFIDPARSLEFYKSLEQFENEFPDLRYRYLQCYAGMGNIRMGLFQEALKFLDGHENDAAVTPSMLTGARDSVFVNFPKLIRTYRSSQSLNADLSSLSRVKIPKQHKSQVLEALGILNELAKERKMMCAPALYSKVVARVLDGTETADERGRAKQLEVMYLVLSGQPLSPHQQHTASQLEMDRLLKTGRVHMAVAVADMAVSKIPSIENMLQAARMNARAHNRERALMLYDKAMKKVPLKDRRVEDLKVWATLLRKQGRLSEAILVLDQAIARSDGTVFRPILEEERLAIQLAQGNIPSSKNVASSELMEHTMVDAISITPDPVSFLKKFPRQYAVVMESRLRALTKQLANARGPARYKLIMNRAEIYLFLEQIPICLQELNQVPASSRNMHWYAIKFGALDSTGQGESPEAKRLLSDMIALATR